MSSENKVLKRRHTLEIFENIEDNKKTKDDSEKCDNNEIINNKLATSSNNVNNKEKNGTWETFSDNTLYVYTSNNCYGRSKIAGYDMDTTLIKTKSGKQVPKDASDWQLLYPEVPEIIKKYYQNGYKIVILSNQGNLNYGIIKVKDFKIKIEKLVQKIGVPMQVFLAAGESIYRKPRTGMWDFLVNHKNDGVPVDKENSFYVGDAAGRDSTELKKKDFSIADRLLATNLNLTFYTPEEHFLGHEKEAYIPPIFNPKEASKNSILTDPPGAKLKMDSQEVIILVGYPGSGKSHFAKTYLSDYCYIHRDIFLRNWNKCISRINSALSEGKSVVVDNTNADKITRQRFIDIAKKFDVPVRCFMMNIEREQIKHNIIFRILTDPNHATVSEATINSYSKTIQIIRRCLSFMNLLLLFILRFYLHFYINVFKNIIKSYRKKFSPPSHDEGFEEIVRINFVPKFNSEDDRKLYEMYLLG